LALDNHSRVGARPRVRIQTTTLEQTWIWVIALAVEANTHDVRTPGGVRAGAGADLFAPIPTVTALRALSHCGEGIDRPKRLGILGERKRAAGFDGLATATECDGPVARAVHRAAAACPDLVIHRAVLTRGTAVVIH
jgi:hypothetical protein